MYSEGVAFFNQISLIHPLNSPTTYKAPHQANPNNYAGTYWE